VSAVFGTGVGVGVVGVGGGIDAVVVDNAMADADDGVDADGDVDLLQRLLTAGAPAWVPGLS
jgi:hypothetical protein